MENRVLELRSDPPAYPPPPRVSNAPSYGQAQGYTLGAQRRRHNGTYTVCIHLTAPDGRILDLISYASPNDTNARGLLSRTTSGAVARLLGTTADRDKTTAALRFLDRVIDEGLDCLAKNITGTRARIRIQTAAEGMAPDLIEHWHTTLPASTLDPRDIRRLIAAGFTPDSTEDWFPTDGPDSPMMNRPRTVTIPVNKEIQRRATYRDHGWTPQQAERFRLAHGTDIQGNPRASAAWAKVGHRHAPLALSAGLTPVEARRLLETGEWDEDTLRVMGGLLNLKTRRFN